ncbi:hypothetical protein [Dactylosporangium sp. CA-233914]|uniref:hypothetical protein n=1 Tax=Dactylosporangium sp. CA-233914 TaxID=3239934 RepID=UPI003D94FA61
MIPDGDSSNVVVPLPAVTRLGSGSAVGAEFRRRLEAGHFEAWICTACGYTEWYALEVNEVLARLSQNPRSGVLYYDADAAAPPATYT